MAPFIECNKDEFQHESYKFCLNYIILFYNWNFTIYSIEFIVWNFKLLHFFPPENMFLFGQSTTKTSHNSQIANVVLNRAQRTTKPKWAMEKASHFQLLCVLAHHKLSEVKSHFLFRLIFDSVMITGYENKPHSKNFFFLNIYNSVIFRCRLLLKTKNVWTFSKMLHCMECNTL